LAQFLARLEEWDPLLLDVDRFASAWIAARTCGAVLHGESSEAPKFDPIPFRKRGRDLIENGVDDILDVAEEQMRVAVRNDLHEFRFDHLSVPLVGRTIFVKAISRKLFNFSIARQCG